MSHWKSFGVSIFAAISLLGETTGSAHAEATEWDNGSIIDLGPGVPESINDAGQRVGSSSVNGVETATEWSNGNVIYLGGSLGSSFVSNAVSINASGQVVGFSINLRTGNAFATEWSGGNTWGVVQIAKQTGSTTLGRW